MGKDKPSEAGENKDLSESWSKTAAQTVEYFNVDPKTGLSNEAVVALQKKHGFNELPAEERLLPSFVCCMLLT
jgi:magnesium-transporting ATPase (P-type)